MANSSKWPVIILVIILIITFLTGGLGFITLQKEKENNAELTLEVEDLQAQKKEAEDKISELNKELTGLKKDINDYKDRITEVNAKAADERQAKEAALTEASRLKSEIDKLINSKSSLENNLKVSSETLESTQKELVALKKAKKELEIKLKDLEDQTQDFVELDKIVVGPETDIAGTEISSPAARGEPASATPGEGKILVVNKEYDFVVVNMGRKSNINVGDTLDVYRKNKKLGQVKIAEARDTMSVATPVSKKLMKQVREEDRVVINR